MSPTNPNQNRLEDALKQALRREEAPANFEARVLTQLARNTLARGTRKQSWWRIFSQLLIPWATAAALATCLIAEGVHYRSVQRERAQGEAAKQQLMLALRIAGSKLHMAKEKVNEINAPQPQSQPENRTPRSRS